ncbi:ATP-binding protein [Streptomyces sp. NPDC001407]|uniref:ATP-binding protein n=1 Tax=unclassified Streptomyces TaxID=2593676 RepID=UPI0036A94201
MVRRFLLFEQTPEQGAHYTPSPLIFDVSAPVAVERFAHQPARPGGCLAPPRGFRGESEAAPRNSGKTRGGNGGGDGYPPWPGSLPTRCGGCPSGYCRESRELPVASSAVSPCLGNCETRQVTVSAASPLERPRLPVRHQVAFAVAPHERSVGKARRMLRNTLIAWGAEAEERVPDAELVASELLTNALRHAPRSELALTAAEGGGSLIIEVEDGGNPESKPAVRQVVNEDAESGRGMTIVEAVAKSWSWRPLPDGGRGTWAVLPWLNEVSR